MSFRGEQKIKGTDYVFEGGNKNGEYCNREGILRFITNSNFPYKKWDLVLCQEKVQIKSELFGCVK